MIQQRRQWPISLGMLVALWFGSALSSTAQVVVVGSGSSISSLTKEEVTNCYLGRNLTVIALDQAEVNPIRDVFYTRLVGKSAAQIKSIWVKLTFAGRARPPQEFVNESDLKKYLAAHDNAIAYIPRANVDQSVRIVYDLQ